MKNMINIFPFLIMITLLLSSGNVFALKSLEGIILGDVKDDLQYDPLENVFDSRLKTVDKSNENTYHRERLMEYLGFYREGENLKTTCNQTVDTIIYSSENKKTQAVQSVLASFQYVGLDLTSRAIGKYARTLGVPKQEYINLTNNLIKNYCSKNLSVYSLKLLKKNLLEKYFGENNFDLPSIVGNPYFPKKFKQKTDSLSVKEKEFALTVKNFRAFCSWGGSSESFRMLVPYLKNPFITSFIFREIEGKKVKWDDKQEAIKLVTKKASATILCEYMICRKADVESFQKKFPVMVGTSSIGSDLKRMYCNLFRDSDYNLNEKSEVVTNWIDTLSFDEEKLEQLQFISLLTGFPDLMNAVDNYSDLVGLLKENIEEKWQKWAMESTSTFSKDLLYEESVEVELISKKENNLKVIQGQFSIDFTVTQGEIDKSFTSFNKIGVTFDLVFPKSLLIWAKRRWNELNVLSTQEQRDEFLEVFSMYFDEQLTIAQEQFILPPWKNGLDYIIAKELLDQLINYPGALTRKFKEDSMYIPIHFKYGIFALKYFRYQFNKKFR
jgi:hypothetical protein